MRGASAAPRASRTTHLMLPALLGGVRRSTGRAQRLAADQTLFFDAWLTPVRCAAAATVSPAAAQEQPPCRLAGDGEPLARALKQAERWIVFSDLHVHQKYEPHWQQALDDVHALAKDRDAGVLFLVRIHPFAACTGKGCMPAAGALGKRRHSGARRPGHRV